MPFLIYNTGPGVKEKKIREDMSVSIGRSKANDLHFSGQGKISRKHCEIYYYPEKKAYVLKDCGSTNGTFLNGNRISSDVILSEGDRISVGNINLMYSEEKEKITGTYTFKDTPALNIENLNDPELTKTLDKFDENSISLAASNFSLNLFQGNYINEFKILRKLGMGEHASVYLGQKKGAGTASAIKVYETDFTTDIAAQEDFLHIMKKNAEIQHIAFVNYIDSGIYKGRCFYAMNYMPNVSLKIRIAKSAPMQELDALDTVSVTATALNYIYNRRGLVHRNLKPSNILFNAGDEIEISDYGLADWTSEYLTAGVSAASPWYISPEQVSGDEMDWYSDLYSLGIILFQMLTGVLPFHSMNEEEVLSMHINNPLPSPESRNPNVKLHSETIEMLRAMTVKAPSRRYSSWTDFLNTIQNLYEKIESEGYNSEPFKPEHTNPPDEPMTSSRIKKQKLRNSNGELE